MDASQLRVAWLAPSRATGWTVAGLLALTLVLRAPGLGRPLLGVFATKNVVYGMIARNWISGRASVLTPTLDCLAADGERAWHLLEVPLPAYAAGVCWHVLGGTLDVWGRLQAVLASAASVLLLYWLVRRWHGEPAARAAAALLAIAPVSVIYGQSFMLEASVVALTLGVIACVQRWIDARGAGTILLAAALFSLLTLTKIYMVVLLPVLWWQLVRGQRAERREGDVERWVRCSNLGPGFVLLLATLPAIGWCRYAFELSTPGEATATRIFYSLRDSGASHAWPHPLLGEPGFYLGVLRNLATVALTPVGLVLVVIGGCSRAGRRHALWLATSAVLLVLLPRKFHEMNYYYLVMLPPLCVIAGVGWQSLRARFPDRRLALALASIGLVCALRYAVRPAFWTPAEDAMVVAAAERVRELTDSRERIVTMHGSGIDLLYYADRRGVAIAPETDQLDRQLAEQAVAGAKLLAVAEQDFSQLPEATQAALGRQRLIESGPGYQLYRLAADVEDNKLAGGSAAGAAEPAIIARERSLSVDSR